MNMTKQRATGRLLALGLATLTFGGLSALATDEAATHPSNTPPAAEPVPAGFWPTDAMVTSLLQRWAAEATDKYELRPDQQRQVERQLIERWTGFLAANRDEIQPLLNEYIEARLAMDPPSGDAVADWAARAMPVFQRLKTTVDEGEQEVRSLLNADQRIRFEESRRDRQFGLQFVEGQLKRWSVGNFKQREWWDPPAGYRAQQRRRAAAATAPDAPDQPGNAAAPLDPPPRVTAELSAWEKYVADFSARLDLDRAQRNAADSILRELIDRARDHVYRHRVRIAVLERKITTGAGEEDEAFDRELAELYGPLDAMFRELEQRLNQLPTTAQRRRAEQPDPRNAQPATSAPASQSDANVQPPVDALPASDS